MQSRQVERSAEHGDASICALGREPQEIACSSLRCGDMNLDYVETGLVESPLPTGSSAVFSDQSVADFR